MSHFNAQSALVWLVVALPPFGMPEVTAAEACSGRDPVIHEPPASRPGFRELVKGEEFETRLEQALANWRRTKQTGSNAPAVGLRVTGVFADSVAERNGVEVGDVLTKIDDQVLWSDALPRTDTPQTLHYYSRRLDAHRTVRLEPGKIGVNTALYWRPERLYLAGAAGDSRLQRLVLAGIVARGRDPDLAETAWHHALLEGYSPDALSDQMGAAIALAQNRPDVAADFAWFAAHAGTEADEKMFVNPLLLYRVALADYHLTEALRLVRRHPKMFTVDAAALERLIALHRRRSTAERCRPSPTVQAQGMYRDDLLPRLVGGTLFSIQRYLPTLQKKEPLRLEVSPAHYATVRVQPEEPTPHFELHIRFTAKPTTRAISQYFKMVYIGVTETSRAPAAAFDELEVPEVLWLRIDEFGDVTLGHSNIDREIKWFDPTVEMAPQSVHDVRMIRVGGQAEMFLNGNRVFYGPVKDAKTSPIAVEMIVNGMTAEFRSMEMTELIERP